LTASSKTKHRLFCFLNAQKKKVTKTGVVGSAQRRREHSQLQIYLNTDAKGEKKTRRANKRQKSNLSGGESNPGLLRVVLLNDKQKY
jgi:hypothetical protein